MLNQLSYEALLWVAQEYMNSREWDQNTSESDRHSYKATKAVVKKAQKKNCFWSFKAGCDLRDTGAMLRYQLGYEVMYQTLARMFDHVSKHREGKLKYEAQSEMNCIAKHKCTVSQKLDTRHRGSHAGSRATTSMFLHSVSLHYSMWCKKSVRKSDFHCERKSYSVECLCYYSAQA